jgi:Type I restriction enzyme R protein N terminus (HSDR_N)
MPPKPYYDVSADAYLFGKSREKPEEKVRQWVLFELLTTYGISINSIQIERQVKVGTRTHFADIVILQEKAPVVVIECKRWDEKKRSQGMQQALSYADANTMKAKYAVYTNGDIWEVKRKMSDSWVDIPDLPKKIDGEYRIELDELVRTINDFKPAFYWFNQNIPASSAKTYFSCLQILFYGATFPLNYLDKNLLFGTDNLLRVICAKGDHPNYLIEKMAAACKNYSAYFNSRLGQGGDEYIKDSDLWHLSAVFQMKFESLVEDTRGLQSEETLLIRFITTLFQYIRKQIHVTKKSDFFTDIPIVLTREFQSLVGFLFQVHLGIGFPDPVLEMSYMDIRSLCSDSWEKFRASL